MNKTKLILVVIAIAAVVYYFKSGEMPSDEPTANNTLVVGKLEYYVGGETVVHSLKGFEITARSSGMRDILVTTDEDGFFSFVVRADGKVWLDEFVVNNGASSNTVDARLELLGASSGVSNIGTIRVQNYGSGFDVAYGYNSGSRHKNGFAKLNPLSPWLEEEWHRVKLTSSNNNN